MNDTEFNTIQSGECLLEVTQALQELDGAGVTELAEFLDMHKSNVHKYLKTLEKKKYVAQNGTKYQLSFRFTTHAEYVKRQSDLYQIAQKRINEMADKIDDVIKFSVLNGNYSIGVYIVNDSNLFEMDFLPGRREYLHQSSPGKAMLAELPDNRVRQYIQESGLPDREPETITETEELFAELSLIRDRGFSIGNREWHQKISGIGAAVVSSSGKIGAINIFGPTASLSEDYLIDKYSDQLVRITSQMEHKIEQRSKADG